MEEIRPPAPHLIASTDRAKKVLAIVGDSQVGLWVVRSLGRGGLTVFSVCASRRGLSACSRYSSGVWAIGFPTEEVFIEKIAELARQLDVGSIVTIAEVFHGCLIRHRDRFEPGIHVFSPTADCFEKATDKEYMNQLCLHCDVSVAAGMTLDALMARSDRPLKFPLVLRSRKLTGSDAPIPWKAAYARDEQQLAALYDSVANRAANVVVQEYHAGVEDHVQILMHDGQPFMVGEYIGEHHMPLAGGVTVQRVSCHHEGLVRDAVKLLQAIGWEGVAGVQFHYDPLTDRYIFLEINPRFIGGLPTVILAGFDAPFLLWQSHFEPERMRRGTYRLGMRTRILGGDANWTLAMLRRDPLPPGQTHVGKLRAIGGFLWHTLPWTHDDTFWLRDLRPSYADLRNMFGRLGQKSHDIIGGAKDQP